MADDRLNRMYAFLHHAVDVMVRRGIRHAVLCPGSRSAPLALAVMRHGGMKYHVVDDERSGGYVALGIAQASHEGVVVITTSGTAVLNLAPAMAEAFYQEVPLLAWTADRPPQAFEAAENQSIVQAGVFRPNVKADDAWDVDFFEKDKAEHSLRVLARVIHEMLTTPRGSVHLNVPIAEPFYPEENMRPPADALPEPPHIREGMAVLSRRQVYDYAQKLMATERVLVMVGHRLPNYPFRKALKAFAYRFPFPVLVDPLSNHYRGPSVMLLNDDFWRWLPPAAEADLRPDLLITFGYRFLSKGVRRWLRQHPPAAHWHVGKMPHPYDPFGVLTDHIKVHPQTFLQQLREMLNDRDAGAHAAYGERWAALYHHFEQSREQGIPPLTPEAHLFLRVLALLPERGILHVGNSLSVRHLAHMPRPTLEKLAAWDVFANRGTSGIDGSLSSAVGHALTGQRKVFAVLGDQSFFYDSNALWRDRLPDNLFVVVVNNHGGRIFEMIPGPRRQPERTAYFVRPHQRSIAGLVEYYGGRYFRATSETEITERWPDFTARGPAFLEIDIAP